MQLRIVILAAALLVGARSGWTQQPSAKQQATYDYIVYTLAHANTVVQLEDCAIAIPGKRDYFQGVLRRIRAADVAFFAKLEAQNNFIDITRSIRARPAAQNIKLSVSECARLRESDFEQHAAVGARLSETMNVRIPADHELRRLAEVHGHQVAEIDACVHRFPEKQRRTVEAYRQFRERNAAVIRVFESRSEYQVALRESKERFASTNLPQLADACSVLEQTADSRLMEHARLLANARALQTGTLAR